MTASPRPNRRKSLGAIFAVPAVVAVLTVAGLLSALLGDGIWDAASWVTLSIPALIAIWFAVLRR